ncbi:ATP-binding protein [Kitasatospora sp. NPDC090308]|uniref:ATP-binding protein n=1 Tax=Kitasatospora sp. NPDC090308 TaxID=3364082 RepID=UPI003827316A
MTTAVPAPPLAPPTADWPERPYRIEEVLRPSGPAGPPLPSVRAALVAAYHRALASGGRPLLTGWYRLRPDGPVRVVAGAPGGFPFLPGTRGGTTERDRLAAELAAFPWWVPLTAAVDLPAPPPPGLPQTSAGPTGGPELSLPGCWPGPFARLLLAHPLGPDELDAEAARLAAAERDARSRGGSPEYQLRADRYAWLHREVRAARSTGLWRVRLLAGGTDAASAATVAGLLVAGHDLDATPHALAPLPPVPGLATALALDRPAPAGAPAPPPAPSAAAPPPTLPPRAVDGPSDLWGDGGHRVPFPAGAELLAELVRVPETEVPGVRLVEAPGFDVTPEPAADGPALPLGRVLDRYGSPTAALPVPLASLNRHAFVCGATGAGKSQTVRTLLEGLSRLPEPVPWLVVEPAKSEYAGMAGRLAGHGGVLVIRPGDPDAVPGCLNPLEPAPGFPLQTHVDLVRALFLASFDAVEPFPQVLAQALTRCYREAGWDVALGEPLAPGPAPRHPGLGDLRRAALQVVEEIGYGRETTDNVRGFIDVRLNSLRLGTPGRFFEGGHPLDLPALLRRNVVLELEDIGSDQDKAFLIGAVLLRITEHLRRRATTGPVALRHVTVIEEAHRLLRNAAPGTPAAHAVELFAGLLAEVRAYGEGIVVAEQIPSKIIPDVLKNSAVKIVHRLPAQDDRAAVGSTMNLTEDQSRQLVALPPGRAAVFTDGMDRPVLLSLPLREAAESPVGADRLPPVQPREPVCGSRCRARPCTLREIGAAARLAEQPRLVLWIEVLVLAHLTGEPAPAPEPGWLAALAAPTDPRTLECAVGHRITEALADRPGLAVHYQPGELAAHLAEVALRQLAAPGAPPPCDGRETHWQAGRFRWVDVHRALTAHPPDGRPHPDTAAWRARGLDLPGADTVEQLDAFRRHPDNHLPPPTLVTGRSDPPAADRAAALLDVSPDPVTRLRRAIAFLGLPRPWPIARLHPEAAARTTTAPHSTRRAGA